MLLHDISYSLLDPNIPPTIPILGILHHLAPPPPLLLQIPADRSVTITPSDISQFLYLEHDHTYVEGSRCIHTYPEPCQVSASANHLALPSLLLKIPADWRVTNHHPCSNSHPHTWNMSTDSLKLADVSTPPQNQVSATANTWAIATLSVPSPGCIQSCPLKGNSSAADGGLLTWRGKPTIYVCKV